jgi:hypothetical protein
MNKMDDLYQWLQEEALAIKTKKFHVFEHQNTDESIPMFWGLLPPSYLAFISKFGSAKLYRRKGNYYKIGVLSTPKEQNFGGEKFLRIGHFDSDPAYFRFSLLNPDTEAPVYELDDERLSKVANSFEEWLLNRCSQVRHSYKKTEWKKILTGPEPFTKEELAIVEARKKIKWTVVGFDDDGDVLLSIKNESSQIIPYYTLGVIARDNSLEGALYLDLSDLSPGEERVFKRNAYKEALTPDNVAFYSRPDPIPEDRESYWEFRKSAAIAQ